MALSCVTVIPATRPLQADAFAAPFLVRARQLVLPWIRCCLSAHESVIRCIQVGAHSLRVLHVTSGNLFGGIETVLVTLARLRHLCPSMIPSFAVCFPGR